MKVLFEKIRIKDFLSLEDEEVLLEGQGIVRITGDNRQDSLFRSNGAGKSSIFDAILWCLSGKTSRGSSAVSNIITGRPAEVKTFLNIDGVPYEITRKKDPSFLQVIRDGEDISGNTLTKTKQVLSETLKFTDFNMLASIIILSQGLAGRISNLTPSERKSRLEMFSDTQQSMDKITERTSLALEKILNESRALEQSLAEKEAGIQSCNSFIEECENKIKNADASLFLDNDEKELIKKQIEEKTAVIAQKKEEYKELLRVSREISSKKSLFSQKLKMAEASLNEEKGRYKKLLQNICPFCGQVTNNPSLAEETLRRIESAKEEYCNIINEMQSLPDDSNSSEEAESCFSEMERISENIKILEKKLLMSESSDIRAYEDMKKKSVSEKEKLETGKLPLLSSMEAVSKEKRIAEWIKKASAKKLRTYLLKNVLDFLNAKLEHYSKFLFDTKTVSLEQDNGNIKIKVGDLEFENLSGGEGRRADIIIQLSLRDLAMKQSDFYCNLLVMDEAFDYLDDAGITNLLDLIDKESATVDTLMVITHKNDVYISSDKEMIVTKGEDGISRISWS